MNLKKYTFEFEEYNDISELRESDAALLTSAREVTANAYAPYSEFFVGATAKLVNGEIISGTNQENASYSAGICAERVLLSNASSLFPNEPIDTIAISYNNAKGESNRPVSPCGICRQAIREFEDRVGLPVRLILSGMEGKIYVIANASNLLPLSFSRGDLG